MSYGTHFVRFCSTLLVLGMFVSSVVAAPPVFSLLPFRKVEVDTKKDYTLTEKNGPWMIMATSFSGESSEVEARKLVLELRRDYQLPAYAHHQEYDYSEPVVGLGVDKFGNPRKMKHLNGAVAEEWAVVVGNFKSCEDPDATLALERIRSAPIKSMSSELPKAGKPVSVSMMREYYRKLTRTEEKKPRGPLGKAFITRNPLLPKEEVAKGALDPFVKELNQGVEHSLLQNKGKYTVQVATFRGATAFNEKEFNESLSKNRSTPKIDEAAMKASKLVAALRKQGAEAYVFHDRFESLVTVGSCNDLGSETFSGRTELRPEIAAVIEKYQAKRQAIPGSDQLALVPQTISEITLDVSPQLILVPRENLADVYSRNRAE